MRRDRLLLTEMLDAAERVVALVAVSGAEAIEADRDRRDALLWNFTVLGEAASQVSGELKGAHPDLPWADPVRLRNRIVHGYWTIDLEVLVATARDDLPGFVTNLRTILEGDTEDLAD